jgi:hypothetical protein
MDGVEGAGDEVDRRPTGGPAVPSAEVRAQYLAALVEVEEDGTMVPIVGSSLLQQGAVHVITGWNPGASRPSPQDNDAANRRLHDLLVSRGLAPVRAAGREPDGAHCEDSWAVVGLTDDEACAIGAAFGQDAVFRIHVGVQSVVSCDGTWSDSRPL